MEVVSNSTHTGLEIAVVGLACRLPGAPDTRTFWRNLESGVESIRTFTDEELEAAGVSEKERRHPRYVPAGAVLEDIEWFDARFFGLNPRDAEIIDPQQRIFLECAWEALEDAGVDPRRFPGAVGVWGGADVNTYLLTNLLQNPELISLVGVQQLRYANRGDTLTTRVAYTLDLTGPAVGVQTTCSTSLVAVHLACQSLLNGECDLALAGGVSIDVGQGRGYIHQEGGILSPDGHCRAFDAEAAGMVSGNGAGLVALARLEDALERGDRIRAVVKGSAINNDGSRKVSYTAPGVDGQAKVVRAAQIVAEVEPDTIGYVEAHGTGTRLGDPIEVAALTRAFRAATDKTGYCTLGSVKTNLGHLDAAAGVTGLIKTALALEHRRIPPSLHYREPNPEIDFESSPFRVQTEAADWEPVGGPVRRAGVSSLGIGGTNAHVILEEAPVRESSDPPSRELQVLPLSARTPSALDQAARRLAERLREPSPPPLADVAHTLARGRGVFEHRRAVVAASVEEAITLLEDGEPRRVVSGHWNEGDRQVVFLFPGQGAQYTGMAGELYEREAVFRREIDRAEEVLEDELDVELRRFLVPPAEARDELERRLAATRFTQPVLLAVEYALARLWESWGLQPVAMLGHSLGEYVAACLAGVMSFEDALGLVAARGRMMQSLPEGSMLSVPLGRDETAEHLPEGVEIAALNGPQLTVVSGAAEPVEALARKLEAEGLEPRRLHTSHAFHSAAMEPILPAFAERVGEVSLSAPRIPFVSNVTGTWIRPEEATDPEYWARHLRRPVRFADGLQTLLDEPGRLFLEVGPGRTASSLVRLHRGDDGRPPTTVRSLRHPRENRPDPEALAVALARLWVAGAAVDWDGVFAGERRSTVGLPTYPFERERYWVDPTTSLPSAASEAGSEARAARESSTPAAGHARPHMATSFVAPEGPIQVALAELWQSLLGIDGVGADDDFFELGGHSLLATQLLSRIRDAFEVELSLEALFDEPTVRELAARIETELHRGRDLALPPIRPVSRSRPLPLSFAQRRLWFLDRLEPGSDAYNMPLAVRLSGRLREEALRRTLDDVLRRHEVLRTTFRETEGDEPVQTVHPVTPWPVEGIDLTDVPEAEREARLHETVAREAHRPFDLAEGPLVRACLVRLAEDEHVALLTLHHIVTDAWSMGILMREVTELYRSHAVGKTPELPELAVQYADFAHWQRTHLEEGVLEEQTTYWRDLLGTDPPVLDLPLDRPRTPERSWSGAQVHSSLDAEPSDALAAFSRRRRATLFMTLLAAYQALLARYAGQDRILVGTPIANRNRSETEDLIGFFVNTLVLQGDVSGNPTFEEFLERVREASLGAHAHQDVPFERLVETLQTERDLSRTPLFQAFFVLQNAPTSHVELPDLTLTRLDEETRSAKFDLSLQVQERDEGLDLQWELATDVLDVSTVKRLDSQLRHLLGEILENAERPVSELPLLTAEERHQVLRWSLGAGAPREAMPVPAEVHRQSRRTPEAPALVAATGEVLTYRELDHRVTSLAGRLRARGVGPETRVAVLARRTPQTAMALLAVLRAGGAFVPLDPTYPEERLRYMMEDSGASLLLAAGAPGDLGSGRSVLRLDQEEISEPISDTVELPVPDLESAAYVIYTSGSTGRPKGVVVPHRALAHHGRTIGRLYGLEPRDRVLQFASLSFDVAYEELFPTWMAGAAVVLRDEEAALDLSHFHRFLGEHRVTVVNLPTAFWHPWVLELETGAETLPSTLRLVIAGTEQALAERLDAWRRITAGSGLRWINAYGPSEATITATAWEAGPDEAAVHRVPIGGPLAHVRAYVLDPRLEPVPPGVPGELCLGGTGVARGYLDRPGQTAERFVPDPHGPDGGRLYRTGDRARRVSDDSIEFLGRVDDQVKIRGFRIEPGEVEAVLVQHPDLRESAVTVAEDESGDKELVAWLAPDSVPAADVKAWAGHRLPAYMVPSTFEMLPELPRTPNGKIDRRSLTARARASEAAGPGDGREPVAPRNDTERALVEIFSEVLGISGIGVHDDFFELGGHSLKVTQVVARTRRRLNVDLPVRRLFEAPTAAALAAFLEPAEEPPRAEASAVEALLEKLGNLSDEEARRLLEEKRDEQSREKATHRG